MKIIHSIQSPEGGSHEPTIGVKGMEKVLLCKSYTVRRRLPRLCIYYADFRFARAIRRRLTNIYIIAFQHTYIEIQNTYHMCIHT